MKVEVGEAGNHGGRSGGAARPSRSFLMHADSVDWFLMALGSLGAVGDGCSIPAMLIIMSRMFDDIGSNVAAPAFLENTNRNVHFFVYLAAGFSVASFLEGYCWTRTGEHQASRMRMRYLRAILRQEMAYFDLKLGSTTEVVDGITTNSMVIQDFLAEKVPNFISSFTTFVAGYAVAFILQWRLALLVFPMAFLLIIPGLILSRVLLVSSRRMLTEYSKAAEIAEQAVSSVRTVYAFRAEERTVAAFSRSLESTVRIGLWQGLAKSLALGCTGITFAVWAFMVWYNGLLVMYHGAKGGAAYAAGISIITGFIAMGSCISNLKCFGEAISASERINEVIGKRAAAENSGRGEGEVMEAVKGEVEFKEVRFAYPTRPDAEVITGFNLKVQDGKTVALVGGSGSGKSTMIALLQRFYEPAGGEILLDGVDIRRLKLEWLRGQMGLVSQEPALFATSIKENIMLGKEDATVEEVAAAAKAAHASGFISHLPQKYDTQVGEGGIQLSGGQKQRIAIARAIIRSPKILLLDEATSALDYESEHLVQEAFENAAAGRTAIVIAHRLSTIRNADTIAFIQTGRVIESGSHDELIRNPDGRYSSLFRLQESQPLPNQTDTYADATAARRSPSTVRNRLHNSSIDHAFSLSLDQLSISSFGRSFAIEEDAEDAAEKKLPVPSFWKLLALSTPEWREGILGCTGALLIGAAQPAYGYFMGSVTSVYFLKDHNQIREKTRIYSLLLLALSLFYLFVNILQHYNLAAMGERLTKRIRERMLSKMLTFEVDWFDEDENSTGALCSRLAKDASIVRSLVGDRTGLIIRTLSSMAVAFSLGLLIAWKLAIVIILLQPLYLTAFYASYALLKKMSNRSFKAQMESSKLAAEAIKNLRTVAAFSSQDRILQLFEFAQAGPLRDSVRQAWLSGFGLGSSMFITHCSNAFSLWYASLLIAHGDITAKQLFRTFPILLSTGRAIAEAGALTSDLSKGASAVASVFYILNRTTLIDAGNQEGIHLGSSISGNIEFVKVHYAYPNRPNVSVLKGLSLSTKAGRSTALVGPSGSGKSTIICLIERFYDPLRGEVRIDGRNIKSYNLRSLRRQIALVGQEPVLFAGTVRDNIAYGADDGVSNAEIEAAARAANAHDFISSLPNGYETSCGKKLSGGQKQRIAIARAILCNPSILLLDEATSAIDGKSEMIVNEALERVMAGRTTVVVAHKLSTVKNCHSIAVLDKGVVVEKGNHASLMKNQPMGKYYKLVSLQSKVTTNQTQILFSH